MSKKESSLSPKECIGLSLQQTARKINALKDATLQFRPLSTNHGQSTPRCSRDTCRNCGGSLSKRMQRERFLWHQWYGSFVSVLARVGSFVTLFLTSLFFQTSALATCVPMEILHGPHTIVPRGHALMDLHGRLKRPTVRTTLILTPSALTKELATATVENVSASRTTMERLANVPCAPTIALDVESA